MTKTSAIPLLLLAACAVVPDTTTTSPSSSPAPDPSPPGSVARPGGDLGRDRATCGAAQNHCLRPGTRFALRALGDQYVQPVFASSGRWFSWDSLGEVGVVEVYATDAATVADLAPGATVIFYKGHANPRGLPPSESEAHADWRIDTVASVDAEASTFQFGRGSLDLPIANARVIVATE